MNDNEKVWKAALYVRLSKEDGDKEESDSITNQKALIRDYLKVFPDVEIVLEMVDDGYSGASFERPAFVKMMNEIKAGHINCIVVKDLSRFGRNFAEAGKYLEQIFPFLGVRFLSVNDRIDSMSSRSYGEKIIVPFKNLMNDAYCRDISIKIRSQLEIKRKKGDFIGSFAVYGYLKDKKNHNRLVVDDCAADVVRMIFKWKIDGMSHQGIAEKLNDMGILSPMEYKRSIGLKYTSTFKVNDKAVWSAVAVGRILKDETYTGVLTQGKSSTPNHKVKKNFTKPKEDWIRVQDMHEVIIPKEIFTLAGSLLRKDMRISPEVETLYLFSGIARCADCGGNMIRKTVPGGNDGKKYFYYVCKNSKTRNCSTHSIKENMLEEAVTAALQNQIKNILDLERIMQFIDTLPLKQEEIQRLDKQLLKIQDQIKRYKDLKVSLYESLMNGIINETEYMEFKEAYSKTSEEAECAALRLSGEIEKILKNKGEKNFWIEQFKECRNFAELTRKVVVSLIEEILVYEDKRIVIKFRYQFNYESAVNFVQTVGEMLSVADLSASEQCGSLETKGAV